MKYFTFGMKNMRVTQSYHGTTSHKPHWYNSKNYADYPIDLAGQDGGQDGYYATVDMKVVAIKGKGNSMTNTIWLVATEKCMTPNGEMTPFIALTHWNDNDPYIAKLGNGSIVKAGNIICLEGVDGATANHLHLVCGNADKGCGNGLIKNSNGSWVSNGYCIKPEEIMYIDPNFTKIADSGGLNFQEVPKELTKEVSNFLGDRGWLQPGDSGENVEKICRFMYNMFPAYAKALNRNKENLLGDYYGENIQAWIKEFQKRTGLKKDGCVGPITLEKLKEYGFKE